jgi:hypothetical protein
VEGFDQYVAEEKGLEDANLGGKVDSVEAVQVEMLLQGLPTQCPAQYHWYQQRGLWCFKTVTFPTYDPLKATSLTDFGLLSASKFQVNMHRSVAERC